MEMSGREFFSGSICLALSPLTDIHVHSKVEVSRKHVMLLDLCHADKLPEDWKKDMAVVDIGEAPALGSLKYVYPDNLRKYLDKYLQSHGLDPADVKIHIPEKITVEMRSVQLSVEDIDGIFKEYILSHAPWNRQDMVIHKIANPSPVTLPDGEMRHEVVVSPREQFVGNVKATIDFYINGEKEGSVRVTGKVDLYRDVVHSARPLMRDAIAAPEDVEVKRINVNEMVNDKFALDVGQVIGKRIARAVGAHQPIFTDFLDRAVVLKQGENVSIVYQNAGLTLIAKGKAQEGGDVGDTVRVTNASSNRTISCRILDAQTVQVIP
jgi:flagella basal body P-ring formation protein FlgA